MIDTSGLISQHIVSRRPVTVLTTNALRKTRGDAPRLVLGTPRNASERHGFLPRFNDTFLDHRYFDENVCPTATWWPLSRSATALPRHWMARDVAVQPGRAVRTLSASEATIT